MQDFFCPKCGHRMLDGTCAYCESRERRRNASGKAGPAAQARRKSPVRPQAPGGEKIISFDAIKTDGQTGAVNKNKKEETVITLVERDEQREKEEAIAKNKPWKAKGLKPAKRVALFISHAVARFTAFVDRLVNPEEE